MRRRDFMGGLLGIIGTAVSVRAWAAERYRFQVIQIYGSRARQGWSKAEVRIEIEPVDPAVFRSRTAYETAVRVDVERLVGGQTATVLFDRRKRQTLERRIAALAKNKAPNGWVRRVIRVEIMAR